METCRVPEGGERRDRKNCKVKNRIDQVNELIGRQSLQSVDLSGVCVVDMDSVLLTLGPEEGALSGWTCRIRMTAATFMARRQGYLALTLPAFNLPRGTVPVWQALTSLAERSPWLATWFGACMSRSLSY